MALEPKGYQGLAAFRSALRQFLAASEAISRDGGITPQQYQALLAMRTSPASPMAVKDLAEQLLLTHHAAVQLIDRLARQGLVEREPSKLDRRTVFIKLTDSGEAILDALAERHLEEILRQEPQISGSLRQLRALGKDR